MAPQEYARADNHLIPRHVLVVERERDAAAPIEVCLASKGFQVRTAQSLPEALALAREFEPRVALVDFHMADDPGRDLVRALEDLQPRIVCVLMVDHERVQRAGAALPRGGYAIIRKPLVEAELLTTLGHCFEKLRLTHDLAAAQAALAEQQRKGDHEKRRADRAVDALARKEQAYRQLVDSLPEVFYRTDADDTITMISPAVTRVLGYPADEVVGMNMTADLYADRRDRDNRRQMLKSTGTVSGQDVILK
ncbi:MAG: response regulator, partial [Desulfobacterales bacterium]